MYSNIYRTLCNNYKECLKNIEQSYAYIDSNDALLSELSRTAFKADIIDLFKVLEEYSINILKHYGVYKSDMSVFEILIKCAQLNKIDKELHNSINRFCSLRDNYLSSYQRQDLTDFISFYEQCKLDLYNQYKLMLNIYEKSAQEAEDEMNLFNENYDITKE